MNGKQDFKISEICCGATKSGGALYTKEITLSRNDEGITLNVKVQSADGVPFDEVGLSRTEAALLLDYMEEFN